MSAELLEAIGWNVPGEDLRRAARRNEESAESFVKGLAAAIRESFLEEQRPCPFAMSAIRDALRARMQEE